MDLDALTERFNSVWPTLLRYFNNADLLSLKFWITAFGDDPGHGLSRPRHGEDLSATARGGS